MIQVVIVAELALRPALLALKSDFIEYFLDYQGMELRPLVLDLAMWAISVPDLLGPNPLFDTIFAKPLFALEALLGVENHVVANDTCEFILVVFLVDQTCYVNYLVGNVFC